mmetsp:Transcript_21518/g.64375  ORF Transcript_21518/g.64375 Transcript_21518/m.64375 type:complete len:335 (-) Transcript_21518:127-1131(-)
MGPRRRAPGARAAAPRPAARDHGRAQRPALGAARGLRPPPEGRGPARAPAGHLQEGAPAPLPAHGLPPHPPRRPHGAVLERLRADDHPGPRGRPEDPGADRRRAPPLRPVPGRDGVRVDRGRRAAHRRPGPPRGHVRRGGRPPDQRLARDAAHVLSPRRALPHADAQRRPRLGRRGARRQRQVQRARDGRRPLALRRRGRARDEPPGHGRGRRARARGHDAQGDRSVGGARDLLALEHARGLQPPAQRAGRRFGEPQGQGRRRDAQPQRALRRGRLLRRGRQGGRHGAPGGRPRGPREARLRFGAPRGPRRGLRRHQDARAGHGGRLDLPRAHR